MDDPDRRLKVPENVGRWLAVTGKPTTQTVVTGVSRLALTVLP